MAQAAEPNPQSKIFCGLLMGGNMSLWSKMSLNTLCSLSSLSRSSWTGFQPGAYNQDWKFKEIWLEVPRRQERRMSRSLGPIAGTPGHEFRLLFWRRGQAAKFQTLGYFDRRYWNHYINHTSKKNKNWQKGWGFTIPHYYYWSRVDFYFTGLRLSGNREYICKSLLNSVPTLDWRYYRLAGRGDHWGQKGH